MYGGRLEAVELETGVPSLGSVEEFVARRARLAQGGAMERTIERIPPRPGHSTAVIAGFDPAISGRLRDARLRAGHDDSGQPERAVARVWDL